jgi:hypothetical protein
MESIRIAVEKLRRLAYSVVHPTEGAKFTCNTKGGGETDGSYRYGNSSFA